MTPDALLFTYVVLLFLGLIWAAVRYELRRRRFGPTRTEDHLFRCEQCQTVYTDDADVDRSRCPHCGQINNVYRF
ncbi:MAG TPA: hypothetical protein PKM73_01945 [Verrucomicrobiota bacterium]|nr:hypothetical protein [Verrucomicrobiota bacterium]HNU50313.1 hypothetical protein [Verrucomicrobiota bacterium]